MGAFFGTAVAYDVVFSLWRWREPGAVCLLAGSTLYLVGSLLVTALFNVPRNETLASIVPTVLTSRVTGPISSPLGLLGTMFGLQRRWQQQLPLRLHSVVDRRTRNDFRRMETVG
jgi:hypothetical protein